MMPKRSILALTVGVSIACGGEAGAVGAPIAQVAPRTSAFVYMGRSRLAVGSRGSHQPSSIIDERRRTIGLDSIFNQPSLRCRRGGLGLSVSGAEQRPQEELKSSSLQNINNNKKNKLRAMMGAIPIILLALVLVNGQATSAWAAKAVRQAVYAVEPTTERVNKVRELLRPLTEAAPFKAIGSTAQGFQDFLLYGPLGQFFYRAWNIPVYAFRPPAPGTFLGNIFTAFRSRLPDWYPSSLVALLSFLPFFEARVGVPIGLALGVPWLKAFVIGWTMNALAIPVASHCGSFFRDLEKADFIQEVAFSGRKNYLEMMRESNDLLGRLSLKKAHLEHEEQSLRIAIDRVIFNLKKGDVMVDAATRQLLKDHIVHASKILLDLPDTAQFEKKLEEELFQTTVGSVLEGSDGAFEEITVAELGQRRAEIAWHPDITLFPGVGQAVITYHLDEVIAQAEYDFQVRPRELQLLRNEVKDLEKEAAAKVIPLREAAKAQALKAREVVKVAKEVNQADEADDMTKAGIAAARRRASTTTTESTNGPPKMEKGILEREAEEDARVAELQLKGRLMTNFAWPKVISYVGIPVPFSGVWTAMFWSSLYGMKFGPTALGSLLGIGLSTLIAVALWMTTSVGGWVGFLGFNLYVIPLVFLYGEAPGWLQRLFKPLWPGSGKKQQ